MIDILGHILAYIFLGMIYITLGVIILYIIYVFFYFIYLLAKIIAAPISGIYNLFKRKPIKKTTFTKKEPEDKSLLEYTVNQIKSILYLVGCSDGEFNQLELDALETLLKSFIKTSSTSNYEKAKLTVNLRNSIKNIIKEAIPVKGYLMLLKNFLGNNENKFEFLSIMLTFAQVDGPINLKEKEVILKFSLELGLNQFQTENIIRKHINSQENKRFNKNQNNQKEYQENNGIDLSYKFFGVQPGCAFNEIKRKYKEKVKKFHPDHLVSKELDKEFLEFANKKMKEINFHYDILKKDLTD